MNNDYKDPFENPDLTDDSSGDPNAMTLNMIAGDGGGDVTGFEDFSPPKKSGSTGMLVLLLAVVVGGGALWAMRMAGSDEPVAAGGTEAEQKIEAALQRLSAQQGDGSADATEATRHALDMLFKDTDEVIAMFANDPTRNQVGLEDLQKNPFKLLVPRSESDSDEPEATPVDEAERARQQRLAELENERSRLKVQSVLTGDPSVAVINDRVVQVGDEVGSFTVSSIGQQGVRLSAEGQTFTLKLASPEDGGSTPRR